MATFTEQSFYGGAIQGIIPEGWVDGSTLREIPDHQELFLSPTTLSSLIIEVNQRVTQEQALSTLDAQSAIRGGIPATHETIDKAAATYHLRDLCDEDDTLQVIIPPAAVTLSKLPASARAHAYKGVVQMTTPKRQRRDTNTGRIPVSVGGAAAGSSADGAPQTSRVTVHYLLVRLEAQESDLLVFFNVPHDEFDLAGDPRGLSREEEVATEAIDRLVQTLEIKDWGLFA